MVLQFSFEPAVAQGKAWPHARPYCQPASWVWSLTLLRIWPVAALINKNWPHSKTNTIEMWSHCYQSWQWDTRKENIWCFILMNINLCSIVVPKLQQSFFFDLAKINKTSKIWQHKLIKFVNCSKKLIFIHRAYHSHQQVRGKVCHVQVLGYWCGSRRQTVHRMKGWKLVSAFYFICQSNLG